MVETTFSAIVAKCGITEPKIAVNALLEEGFIIRPEKGRNTTRERKKYDQRKEEKRQNSALMAYHAMDTDLILTKSMRHLVRLTMQYIPT